MATPSKKPKRSSPKKRPKRSSPTKKSEMCGEYRSGPIAGTALLAGVTFARKGVQYAEVNGLAIFEGDIVLGTMDEVSAAADAGGGELPQFACGITGQQFRWPDATIPYEIDPALPNQQRISDAIAHWEANTRIRFVLRTPANASQHPDFVRFQPDPSGCWSYVGRRRTGAQGIGLASGCSIGNTIHEIGHAVGLWHEHSREDRDTLVQIVWANIPASAQHNFTQHISDGDDYGPYDYGSIMHYSGTAFSTNGATIIALQPLPPGVVMGQRNGLSQGDIDGVHAMYPTYKIKEATKDPMHETVKEPLKDPLKDPPWDTTKEVGKDPAWDTTKEVGKDPNWDTIKEAGKDPFGEGIGKPVGRDGVGGTLAEQIRVPGLLPGRPRIGGLSPFVLAAPSRVGGRTDPQIAEVCASVRELAQVLLSIQQQQAELMQAYAAAVQALDALLQGVG